MDRLTYIFFLFLVNLFRILPFRIIYMISDGLFFILYYVIGYRKTIVTENLRNSFPQKNSQEIREISKAYYHHLSDILLEGIKALTMNEESALTRYRFQNPELMDDLYRQNRNAMAVGGHYNNWEWGGIAFGKQILYKSVAFYKPLSNKYVDNYLTKSRVKGRTALVSISDTADVFKKNWGEPAVFIMVADQSPSSTRLAYWVNFLNQDTPALHGPEKYARIYNLPVVYGGVKKIRRGYYELYFRMICDDPSKTRDGEITEKFMQMLEEDILSDPRYYLWSHRRWKHKRVLQ